MKEPNRVLQMEYAVYNGFIYFQNIFARHSLTLCWRYLIFLDTTQAFINYKEIEGHEPTLTQGELKNHPYFHP